MAWHRLVRLHSSLHYLGTRLQKTAVQEILDVHDIAVAAGADLSDLVTQLAKYGS